MTENQTTQPAATADLKAMPMPTKLTLRIRNNLPYQFSRLLVLSGRMVRMVIGGHH